MGSSSSKAREGIREPARFSRIPDKFESLEEVTAALRAAGLEASQLVVGVDFTKSNTWTGEKSFGGRCLHDIRGPSNPYLTALSLIAWTLEPFDDDNLIPCYGFGDVTTREHSVFSFYPGNQPANGLQAMLARYRQIAPLVDLSGPTSFAPLIRQTMRHVYHTGMEFHLLMIIADGQISTGCLEDTRRAIVEAASFPISIVTVGVGDGPWDVMEEFDDELPARGWDNFQFVNFNKIMSSHRPDVTEARKEASFALHALMELPEQYQFGQRLMGSKSQSRVQHIVAKIPNTVLIDPPAQCDVPSIDQAVCDRFV